MLSTQECHVQNLLQDPQTTWVPDQLVQVPCVACIPGLVLQVAHSQIWGLGGTAWFRPLVVDSQLPLSIGSAQAILEVHCPTTLLKGQCAIVLQLNTFLDQFLEGRDGKTKYLTQFISLVP